jgi:hypothetical protein
MGLVGARGSTVSDESEGCDGTEDGGAKAVFACLLFVRGTELLASSALEAPSDWKLGVGKEGRICDVDAIVISSVSLASRPVSIGEGMSSTPVSTGAELGKGFGPTRPRLAWIGE